MRLNHVANRLDPRHFEVVVEMLVTQLGFRVLRRTERSIWLRQPGAWLLNFGRGQAIVDADLIAAVRDEHLAGAVLDVFREEPLPTTHPFWTTPGILVVPHMGGMHPERDKVVARLLAENLGRFLDGKPLKEVVDREVGY